MLILSYVEVEYDFVSFFLGFVVGGAIGAFVTLKALERKTRLFKK